MTNVERLERRLSRELSRLIPQLKDPRVPLLVTVKELRLSSNGQSANVLVSTLNQDEHTVMVAALNRASGYLQRELASTLGLKYTPKLSFRADRTEA